MRWLAGDATLCAALERAWLDPDAAGARLEVLRDRPERRRLLRVRLVEGPDLFVKQFHPGVRKHRLRKRLVRGLRIEAARREWRSLSRLARAGVAVPTPRGLAALPDGGRLLAMDYVEGRPLGDELAVADGPRNGLVQALGELVAGLHRAGLVHRDLHAGNILVGKRGAVLLDLQLALPRRARAARLRDLGELDNALEGILSLTQRVRLRARALGLARPFGARERQALRAVARAARGRGRAQAASRMRRARRAGRRFVRFADGPARGLRLREVDEAALRAALAAHRGARDDHGEQPHGGRSSAVAAGERRVVVQEFAAGGALRRLLELARGSPARRAWLAGHGLQAHRIGSATPIAVLERRRWALPSGSLVVLEDLRPARRAEATPPDQARAAVDALARLALRLHARGVHHARLEARHVWLAVGRVGLEPRLGALEQLSFPRRLGDRERLRSLARLDASLPDAIPAPVRRQAWLRYATLLPFAGPPAHALARIAAESQTLRSGGAVARLSWPARR